MVWDRKRLSQDLGLTQHTWRLLASNWTQHWRLTCLSFATSALALPQDRCLLLCLARSCHTLLLSRRGREIARIRLRQPRFSPICTGHVPPIRRRLLVGWRCVFCHTSSPCKSAATWRVSRTGWDSPARPSRGVGSRSHDHSGCGHCPTRRRPHPSGNRSATRRVG
jgi:hypothetical protein